LDRIFEEGDSFVEGGPGVREGPASKQELAEEIGKHPASIFFVAIKAGDAKVFGSRTLDTIVEEALGFV
jgi:hypothetical protein